MKRLFFSLLFFTGLFCQTNAAFSQSKIELYPPNWWPGMKWNKVQILAYAPNNGALGQQEVTLKHRGVTLDKVHRLENGKYLALDVTIAPDAQPGSVLIQFTPEKGRSQKVEWQLSARREGKNTDFAQGVTSEDFIYLLMPDRFSNGNPTNDRMKGMRDQSLNRDSIFLRHGGDLQGVINHLDYLQQLGVTALWMTPPLENDMPNRTEHGYACTNHYKIDPRHGSNDTYKQLSNELHRRGMKLVQDAVYNHLGSYHFTILDMPEKNWVHQWTTYTNTTYKDQPLMDLYGAEKDRKQMTDGWFVPTMPDLNQKNPYVANFLIQHAIWSVEEFGVDGFRIDTYIYNDLEFMNRCNAALLEEYPNITMFGETWVHGVLNQAYFTENNLDISFKSNLPGVTDFQTNLYGIGNALNEPFGWTEGVSKLYTTLSNDFVYKNPMNHVIFLDNHDKTRFFTYIKQDLNKYKTGIAWLLTCRGIPQLYYGTEVLMTGDTYPFDGYVRLDFPGGWQGDKVSGFTGEGLTAAQTEAQNYVKTLANYRKNSPALTTGKMMQYVPKDGVYVYFRYTDNQTVMCIMNTADSAKEVTFADFDERTGGFSKAVNVVNPGEVFDMTQKLSLNAKTMLVLELKR
ncbi:alpha-amylase [Sphingobacteriales bacterium UPWRP_1]|nr:alpha-amylase [Sphingobacteriales bacterium TSM_CSS]PSJ75570.1 alpha-amylase [Sphingobacteriales bacterium UPWRP_1]